MALYDDDPLPPNAMAQALEELIGPAGEPAEEQPPRPPASEAERREQIQRASLMTLDELQGYIDRAEAGEMVLVPDGLPEVIRRLRYNLTQALGPQEAGDLGVLFRALDNRLQAVESGIAEVQAAQRWTVGYWLGRILR